MLYAVGTMLFLVNLFLVNNVLKLVGTMEKFLFLCYNKTDVVKESASGINFSKEEGRR